MSGMLAGKRAWIVGTNDPKAYSGGRYHALMMAYALAQQGADVTFATNFVPAFDADLRPLCPGGVRFLLSETMRFDEDPGALDWLVVVPTGVFHPEFYEEALRLAGLGRAHVALINFESANWFNSVSSTQKDVRIWDYWRQSMLDGGLVLSSAREAEKHARQFYRPVDGPLRHEIWSPPINSPVADQFVGAAKSDRVVMFARPTDAHKGAGDLLSLPANSLKGSSLTVLLGRPPPADFEDAVKAHFKGAAKSVKFSVGLSDEKKFEILASARALLFPSRFEGYGYPPVEAAYVGTIPVCYDLPVLRETVGKVARFAPPGDAVALGAELAAALRAPADPAVLQAAVRVRASFALAAASLADILIRSESLVPKRVPVLFRVWSGPRRGGSAVATAETTGIEFPARLTQALSLPNGDVIVSGEASPPVPPSDGEIAFEDGNAVPLILLGTSDGTCRFIATLAKARIGKLATIRLRHGDASILERRFTLDEPASAIPGVRCGTSEHQFDGKRARLRSWVLSHAAPNACVLFVGGRRQFAKIDRSRADLRAKFPGYPSYVCEFRAEFEAEKSELDGLVTLALANGRIAGAFYGWPPQLHAAHGKAMPRAVEVDSHIRSGRLSVADLTDKNWFRGIGRQANLDTAGIVAVSAEDAMAVRVGDVLELPHSGKAAVVRVETHEEIAHIGCDRSLHPMFDGYPGTIAWQRPEAGEAEISAAIANIDDDEYSGGLSTTPPRPFAEILIVPPQGLDERRLAGASIQLATSGERRVLEATRMNGSLRLTLDRPAAFGDAHPTRVRLRLPAQGSEGAVYRLLKWTAQIASPESVGSVHVSDPGGRLKPDQRVVLSDGVTSGISDIARQPGGVAVVTLSDPAPIACLSSTGTLTTAARTGIGSTPTENLGLTGPDAAFFSLLRAAPATGIASERAPRTRTLFVTIVPPEPADQGNRLVTRSLIDHLVALDHDLDVLFQGWFDVPRWMERWPGRVRFFHVGHADWAKSPEKQAREQIVELIRKLDLPTMNAWARQPMLDATKLFHPYTVLRQDTVDYARRLMRAGRYDFIVCNYLHTKRVLDDLASEFELPPSCVITHDALSQLDTHLGALDIDTAYRRCTPAVEGACLAAIDNCTPVAISRAERRHFEGLGTGKTIVLCEYDALDEMMPFRTTPESFESKQLFFHGSGNPLNVEALNFFLSQCWLPIREACPEARLLIAGGAGEKIRKGLPGVEILGVLPREELYAAARACTLAINPSLVGTGLKIKSVEAAAMGLPSVVLPRAIDGLEEDADRFALVAQTPEEFVKHCINLLTDPASWLKIRDSAIALAEERFSSANVYAELDRVMGWGSLETPRTISGETHAESSETDSGAIGGSDPGPGREVVA